MITHPAQQSEPIDDQAGVLDLIAEYVETRDQLDTLKAASDGVEKRRRDLEQVIHASLDALALKSIKMDRVGTITRSERIIAQIENHPTAMAWAKEQVDSDGAPLVELTIRRAPFQKAVARAVKHNQPLPPGADYITIPVISLRRSSKES